MPSPLAAFASAVAGLLDRSRAGFDRLDSGRQALTLGVVVLDRSRPSSGSSPSGASSTRRSTAR